MQAISPGPVCPQSLPTFPKNHNTANGSEEEKEALSRMPKPRLRFLQMIRAQLLRQSEDCLYLNIYVPQSVIDRRASEQVLKKQGRPIFSLLLKYTSISYSISIHSDISVIIYLCVEEETLPQNSIFIDL